MSTKPQAVTLSIFVLTLMDHGADVPLGRPREGALFTLVSVCVADELFII